MTTKLLWVPDSPYSRSIKWLLLRKRVMHHDYFLTWETMKTDQLLKKHNAKLQVPTLINEGKSITDSLLIALKFLPHSWHETMDAQLFRLADSDIESAIIFLFRANLLSSRFGISEQSEFLLKAGIDLYKASVDYLLDDLLLTTSKIEVNFGLILLYSTMLAASSVSGKQLTLYRQDELKPLSSLIEQDCYYQKMISSIPSDIDYKVPFLVE